MNIFRQEIKMFRLSLLLWIIAIILLSSIYMSVYPAFNRDSDSLRQMLSHFPAAAQTFMGVGVGYMFSFLGFFGNVFPFVTLIGGVMAMNLGLGLLHKEKLSKTTDFLLSKPVSRGHVFRAKLLAGVFLVTITSIVVAAAAFGVSQLFGVGEYDIQKFSLFWLVFYIIQLWFLAFGMVLSQLYPRIKSVIAISLSVVFGFFIMALLAVIIGDENIRYLTPFKYFRYLDIVTGGTMDVKFIVIAATFVIVSITSAYVIYRRKDVTTP